MRKSTFTTFIMILACSFAFAQSADKYAAKAKRSTEGATQKSPTSLIIKTNNQPEVTIWDEDFGSGIPSTWVNAGFDGFGNTLDSALWEYRGTSTNPDNTEGSRGAYVGTRGPIQSASAANGFMIFDSDA